MKKLIIISLIATILTGCSSSKKLSESEISILGTTWEYSDSDWIYLITFCEDGKIKSTHPNDSTPENDFWSQSNNQIRFEFNNGFSKYSGEMKKVDLIVGKGKSTSGEWSWKMKRIK